jgi:hypothetical protein
MHAEQELALEHQNLKLQEITMSHIADIAAEAWNSTKPKEDPLFADCILTHQQNLVTLAESVERVGLPTENPTEFDKAVKDLLDHPDKAAAAIGKTKIAAAQANADAAAVRAKDVAAGVAAEAKAAAAAKAEGKK